MAYFQKNNAKTLQLKESAIYDIVLTNHVSLDESVSISGVNHETCIPGKCDGKSIVDSRKFIIQIAKERLEKDICDTGLIKKAIKKYPDIEGETLEIAIE